MTARLPDVLRHGSNAMLKWQEDRQVAWHCIAPGKPMRNGLVESFNARMREECRHEHLFPSLRPACRTIAAWRTDYTHHRPHSNLAGLTPHGYANRSKDVQNLNRTNLSRRMQRAQQRAENYVEVLDRCCDRIDIDHCETCSKSGKDMQKPRR